MSPAISAALLSVAISVMVIVVITLVYQRQLGKHRGVSRDEFIRAFADSDIPAEIPGAVYDYYKSGVISKQFSVAPDDDYEHVLSEGDEDIDDDAMFIIKALRLKVPTDYAEARTATRIQNLRDMVVWLDWVRQHQPS